MTDQLLESAATPAKVKFDGLERDDGGLDDVMGSFSGMRLHNPNNKRQMEQDTAEGSPVNVKRLDLQPTPVSSAQIAQPQLTNITSAAAAAATDENPQSGDSSSYSFFSRGNVVGETNNGKEVVVLCSASEGHDTGNHQENALRTALLCGPAGCLRRAPLKSNMKFISSDSIEPAPLVDLLRVHDFEYLRHIEYRGNISGSGGSSDCVATSKSSSHTYPPWCPPNGSLDVDTPLRDASLEAAKRFCGAALLAVDYAMQHKGSRTGATITSTTGSFTSSSSSNISTTLTASNNEKDDFARIFVLGRPPGHHAGSNGCVPSQYYWQRPDMTSSGFCLLNTVAVAAAYARHRYGREAITANAMATANKELQSQEPEQQLQNQEPGNQKQRAPRIAIVDIDIHHGNGTEDIVRNLRPREVHLPLPSSWAPQSKLCYKPWLDETDSNEVFFSSIQLYAEERFYPGSGKDEVPAVISTPQSHSASSPSSSSSSTSFTPARSRTLSAAEAEKAGLPPPPSGIKVKIEKKSSRSNSLTDEFEPPESGIAALASSSTVPMTPERVVRSSSGEAGASAAVTGLNSPSEVSKPQRPNTSSKVAGMRSAVKATKASKSPAVLLPPATQFSTCESSLANKHSIPPQVINIALTPVGPGPWDRKKRATLTAQQKEQYCATASAEFR